MHNRRLEDAILNIACMTVNELDALYPGVIVEHAALSIGHLFRTPHMRAQAMFIRAWMKLHGLPPTPLDIAALYQKSKLDSRGVIACAIESSYARLAALRGDLPAEHYVKQLQQCIEHGDVKDAVVQRLQHRAASQLLETDMMKLVQNPVTTKRLAKRLANPITGNAFDAPPGLEALSARMTPAETLRAACTMDHPAQYECTRSACAVVDGRLLDAGALQSLTIQTLDVVMDALSSGQQGRHRPVVFLIEPLLGHGEIALSNHHCVQLSLDDFALGIPRTFASYVVLAADMKFATGVGLEGARTSWIRLSSSDATVLVSKARDTPLPSPLLVSNDATWPKSMYKACLTAIMKHDDGAPGLRGLAAYYRYMARRCIQTAWFEHVNVVVNSRHAVLAIDNRPNPLTVFAVLNTLSHIGVNNFAVVIVTSPMAAAYYKEALPVGATVIDDAPFIQRSPFVVEDYNRLLKSPWVWKRLQDVGITTALLVQDDGFIVRPPKGPFPGPLQAYSYVGAPWSAETMIGAHELAPRTRGLMTGNGGLSLRHVPTMLRVVANRASRLFCFGTQTEPEDVFFAAGILELENDHSLPPPLPLCPGHIARTFACEQVFDAQSLGFHKVWAYNDEFAVSRFFDGLSDS